MSVRYFFKQRCFVSRKRLLSSDLKAKFRNHPTVDVSVLFDGDGPSEKRKQTISAMAHAMRHQSYFIATNVVPLPASYVESVYTLSSALHDLPRAVKESFVKPNGTYSGADVPGHEEDAYEPGTAAAVRSFDYSRVKFAETSPKPRYPSVAGMTSIEVETALDDLYERQDSVASTFMVAFAEMLNLQTETFVQHFVGGDLGTVRLLHYPTAGSDLELENRARANIGISPHTDFEFFTLMHQQQAGLQILANSEGSSGGGLEWADVPVTPGGFVVVAGDMFERFTNGEVLALPHRVLCTPHSRNAIIRFNALRPETVVSPLPAFVTPARPAAYTAVTMKQHMTVTMGNLKRGLGAWSSGDPGHSLTARYTY
jgi:isopenicillin N synthase-like dioxygenase